MTEPTITPVDHTAGQSGVFVEMYEALTDEQLAEQAAFWVERMNHYRSTPDPDPNVSMYRKNNYAAYRYGVRASEVDRVIRARQEARRHENERPVVGADEAGVEN
jgi:hypothetical protein